MGPATRAPNWLHTPSRGRLTRMVNTRGLILTAALALTLVSTGCSGDEGTAGGAATTAPVSRAPMATSTSTATGNPFGQPSGESEQSDGSDASEVAEVEQTLRTFLSLAQAGQGKQACAMQTEAYTAYDDQDGDDDGGCVEEVATLAQQLKKEGHTYDDPTMHTTITDEMAIVTFTFPWWKQTADYYLTRQDDGTWLISGDSTSGPL